MKISFTSESVAEGHPDKVCDAISDRLVDLYISRDPSARTAIETMATTNRVILAGETSSVAAITTDEMELAVREVVKSIGYQQAGFNWQTLEVTNFLHRQSPDIAQGVDQQGAGDQGIMFGFAKNEPGFDCCYMPLAIKLSHQILQNLSRERHNGNLPQLGPDAKSQVTVEYEHGTPVGISKIVVSTQHREDVSQSQVRELVRPQIAAALPEGWMPDDKNILINPTGRFVIGGPDGDAGLTGRKIIVDTYGGYAPHGGGAFSGKDPTKVDRSAAYMLRWLSKNVVAAGLAEQCLLQISYAIGVAEPLSFYINTFGTSQVDENKILTVLRDMVNLTPAGIIKQLDLQKPIYFPTTSYGHFGRTPGDDGTFSWEKLNLVKDLQTCF